MLEIESQSVLPASRALYALTFGQGRSTLPYVHAAPLFLFMSGSRCKSPTIAGNCLAPQQSAGFLVRTPLVPQQARRAQRRPVPPPHRPQQRPACRRQLRQGRQLPLAPAPAPRGQRWVDTGSFAAREAWGEPPLLLAAAASACPTIESRQISRTILSGSECVCEGTVPSRRQVLVSMSRSVPPAMCQEYQLACPRGPR